MFGRAMVITGTIATLGLGLAATQGYQGAARGAELRLHVLTGLAALLVFVLAHAWVLFYLAGAARVIGEGAREAGLEGVPGPALARFSRRTLPPLLGALGAVLALFVSGISVYAGQLSGAVHGALFWLTVALEAWAAWAEWRALTAGERAAARIEAVRAP